VSGRHVTAAGAAVILDALVRARGDTTHTFFKEGVPTSVQAFFKVHGADLQALLEGLAADIDRNVSVPTAYDVLQIAHRVDANGSADAPELRRLADWMIAKPETNLLIVGRVYSGGLPWTFEGVFSNREAATDACLDDTYFIGPATLDERLPVERWDWPGCEYPKAKTVLS
jgi:hypothetical protein